MGCLLIVVLSRTPPSSSGRGTLVQNLCWGKYPLKFSSTGHTHLVCCLFAVPSISGVMLAGPRSASYRADPCSSAGEGCSLRQGHPEMSLEMKGLVSPATRGQGLSPPGKQCLLCSAPRPLAPTLVDTYSRQPSGPGTTEAPQIHPSTPPPCLHFLPTMQEGLSGDTGMRHAE